MKVNDQMTKFQMSELVINRKNLFRTTETFFEYLSLA